MYRYAETHPGVRLCFAMRGTYNDTTRAIGLGRMRQGNRDENILSKQTILGELYKNVLRFLMFDYKAEEKDPEYLKPELKDVDLVPFVQVKQYIATDDMSEVQTIAMQCYAALCYSLCFNVVVDWIEQRKATVDVDQITDLFVNDPLRLIKYVLKQGPGNVFSFMDVAIVAWFHQRYHNGTIEELTNKLGVDTDMSEALFTKTGFGLPYEYIQTWLSPVFKGDVLEQNGKYMSF